MVQSKKEYDDEPVLYCDLCLSLKIRYTGGEDYCDSCGSIHISETDIDTWSDMYKKMYGEDSVVTNNYLKEFLQ